MMFSRIQTRLYLKVWTGDALGDLLEERLLDLDELSGLDHVEDLLDLTQEHHLKNAELFIMLCSLPTTRWDWVGFSSPLTHLLLGASLWPELEQPLDDLLRQGGVLLQELHDAVRQLRVVQRQTPHLVQRDQNLKEDKNCEHVS